ncbi:hypothetical protein ANTPLA_LOCUS7554 [Anthophora plagiata]
MGLQIWNRLKIFVNIEFATRFLRQSGSQTVKTCLSSEEKQKMAASCGQVQPPSSTLLISVRRKRDERRPRIVLHRR